MKSNRIGIETLTCAARAAGYVMLPVEPDPASEAPAQLALPAPVGARTDQSDPLEVKRAQLRSTANSVTGWIRDHVPLLGRGAPA